MLYSRVDVFDVSNQIWSIAELSEARTVIGGAKAGNKVVFAGGARRFDYGLWGWFDFTATLDVCDALTNSWTATELPEADYFVWGSGVTACASNKALFYSDSYINFIDEPRVYIFDGLTNALSTALLSEPRNKRDVASASFENKALFAGGHFVSLPGTPPPYVSKRVDIYDASNNSWSIDSLAEARAAMTGCVLNNKAYFAGGQLESGDFANTVEIYDNDARTWSTRHLSRPTILVGAAAMNEKVLFFGDTRIEIYDPASDSWSVVESNKSFGGSTIIAAGGSIYLTDGTMVWRLQF